MRVIAMTAAACAALFSLCAAAAAPRRAPAVAEDFWIGLGGGAYTGQDYDAPAAAPARSDDAYDVGGYAAHGTLNLARKRLLLRLRGSWLEDYTSNTAEEVALAIGLPVTADRNTWFTVGVSRLTDVSNQKQAPTVGVPFELLHYPVRGLELMLHGNINDDSSFIGIAIGGAIGRARP